MDMSSQLPTRQLSKENLITDIPYYQRCTLCAKLDIYDDWKKFVGYIPSVGGTSPRYNDLQMHLFDKKKVCGRSPTSAILNDWRSSQPTIGELLNLLKYVELRDSASYIEKDILQNTVILTENTPNQSVKHYTYAELNMFTENFNRDPLDTGGRFLGAGGYGEVYLGRIDTSTGTEMVAVKKLHESSLDYLNQFKTELEVILLNCQHQNLLSIKGVCTEKAFCVVYEYMGRGTVEQRLAGSSDKSPLSADQRLQIAIDVAQGLDRLHHNGAKPIVHRDVKPANILLDDHDRAKLGDYGLVRIQTLQDDSHTNMTTKIHGTSYYMPPEAMTGMVSPKWDVYSLGVVLLELLFARGPEYKNSEGYCEKMIEYLFDDDPDDESQKNPLLMLDPNCNWDPIIAQQILDLAERCGQKLRKRPSISRGEDSVLETLLRIQENSKSISC